MNKMLIFSLLIFYTTQSFTQDIKDGEVVKLDGKKVVYTYKQYEKFDFDDLNIEGDTGTPSDISISPIHEKRFSNRLPYRKSFTVEIKKGVERVR